MEIAIVAIRWQSWQTCLKAKKFANISLSNLGDYVSISDDLSVKEHRDDLSICFSICEYISLLGFYVSFHLFYIFLYIPCYVFICFHKCHSVLYVFFYVFFIFYMFI